MRKVIVMVSFFLILSACNSSGRNDGAELSLPENAVDEIIDQVSPRVDAAPTATTLPPTWTPLPMEHAGHLQEGGGSVPIFETRVEYVVQRGDTLAEICDQYGVSIAEVARINNISDWDHIEVGQVITLPLRGN